MSKMELVCPAGTPTALKTAIEAGADTVYVGFRNETNARNFPGLNFNLKELEEGLDYAHTRKKHVYVAINTYPEAGNMALWHQAVDDTARLKADAVIVADIGLAHYVARKHPDLRLHLSVQASASNPDAISFYCEEFGVKRVVLPRVLTIPEIATLNKNINCETEVFVFGGLCVMAEGRCALSSYVTGKSPNMNGVCSPASHVRYDEDEKGNLTSSLGTFLINRFKKGENAGYPTLCKGRFNVNNKTSYIFEEPTSLNAATMLPELKEAGVVALKIEGRQRSKAYVQRVVSTFRQAVDTLESGGALDLSALLALSEGQTETQGAYKKKWR